MEKTVVTTVLRSNFSLKNQSPSLSREQRTGKVLITGAMYVLQLYMVTLCIVNFTVQCKWNNRVS